MAIYHLNQKVIQRSRGHSVVAAAAYRHAAKMFSQEEGKSFNYTQKDHVVYTEILIPKDSPAWLSELVGDNNVDQSSENLWNAVEREERRKDAQLARELEFSIPIELTQEQGITLVKEFIQDQIVAQGMVADVAIHWDHGNPHAHVLMTMREITPEGFGLKQRAWNDKAQLQNIRLQWSQYANFHLKMHGHDVRIDHRSYKDQGIDLEPGVHEGKATRDMEKRGIVTERKKQADWVRRENLTRIVTNPQAFIDKMSAQRTTFSEVDVVQSLGGYVNDKGCFDFVSADTSDSRGAENFIHVSSERTSPSMHVVQRTSVDGQDSGVNSAVVSDEVSSLSVLSAETIAELLSQMEHHDSVFNDQALAKAIVPYTDNAEMFARAILQIKASSELMYLGVGDDGRDRYTTRHMFAIENEIQSLGDALLKQSHPVISDQKRDELLAAYQRTTGKVLEGEQLEAVQYILGKESIRCVVGRAGTGKSFSLGAAKAVWEGVGARVYGVALSGIATDGLEKDAQFDSRTITAFLLAIEQGKVVLDANTVIVMDEAGMADSESLLAVLRQITQAKAKLVLVGDHGQLQPVGPGAAFRALLERVHFKELTVIRRQNHAWQRAATSALSAGSVDEALAAYAKEDCVHLDKDSTAAMSRLVEDWFVRRADTQEALSEFLIVAHSNEDVNLLNDAIRAGRVAREEVASGYSVSSATRTISLAQGDRLLFTKNNSRLGVKNGRFGTVESINFTETGRVIAFSVRLDGSDKVVTVDPTTYKHFALGYAATVHKTQGMTVNHAFVYVSGLWNRCLTYVAMTRHKMSCHVYAGQDGYANEVSLARSLGRYGLKDSVLDFPMAFAERHGLDTTWLSKVLPEHIAQRLQGVATRVKERYRQVLTPGAYREEQLEKERTEALAASRTAQIAAVLQRRVDAKDVAAYCDAHQDVGVAWGLLYAQLQPLGLDSISYDPKDFEVISALSEYQVYREALAQRNALAHSLINSPKDKYSIALDANNVDLGKLTQHAASHACLLRVQEYVALKRAGNGLLYEAHALAICKNNLLKHFPYLSALGVDTSVLRREALEGLRRHRVAVLSPQEQDSYAAVSRYRALVSECGAYYAEHLKGMPKDEQDPLHVAHLQALSVERDQWAACIAADLPLHAEALHFYHIGSVESHFGEGIKADYAAKAVKRLPALHKHAEQYAKHVEVAAYLSYQHSDDASLRNTQALLIMRRLKQYYPQLKAQGVDVAQLRRDALLAKRDVVLANLSAPERKAFLLVERYRAVVTESGRYYADFIQDQQAKPDSLMAREQALHWEALNQERDRLAAIIQRQQDVYGPAMQYHDIGSVQAHFGESICEQQQAQAADRLAKLEVYAMRHRLRDHIQEYARETDVTKRMALAFDIKQNSKGHFSAMMQLGLDNTEGRFWKALSLDAKRHERLQFYKEASFIERLSFKEVEAYVVAKRQHGQAWQELFASKGLLSEAMFADWVKRYAEPYTVQRDALAAQFLAQPYAYQKSLAFLGVKVEELQKPAATHSLREQVAAFVTEANVMRRAEMAQSLINNIKLFSSALKQQGVSLKSLYTAMRPLERQALFSEASLQERQLMRSAVRYQKIHRQLGKTYGQLKTRSIGPEQRAAYQNRCGQLSAKRDALAAKLMSVHRTTEIYSLLGEIQEVPKVRQSFEHGSFHWEKIAKQALTHDNKHQELATLVEDIQQSQRYLMQMINQNKPSNAILNNLMDWYSDRQDSGIDHLAHQILVKPEAYSAVLTQAGLNIHTLQQQRAIGQTVDTVLTQWLKLQSPVESPVYRTNELQEAEMQRRIERARTIEQGSQPITGTLAERYLREHRAISGPIPDSYRYHPGVYHGEVKQKCPALVVVAKNEHNQTQAVQVIYLDQGTANKAKVKSAKLTYGRLSDGHIGVLANEGNNSRIIAIAEGPETALSIAEARPDLRVYAVLGSGNLARAPLAPDTRNLLICADNDGEHSASQKKIRAAAERYASQGIDVQQVMPDEIKQDFNDVLKNQGLTAVKDLLAKPILLATAVRPENLVKQVVDQIHQEPIKQNATESKAKSDITAEQKERYTKVLKRYKELKQLCDESPYMFGAQETLKKHVDMMLSKPKFMRYVKDTYPKMAKNFQAISKGQSLEITLDIDL